MILYVHSLFLATVEAIKKCAHASMREGDETRIKVNGGNTSKMGFAVCTQLCVNKRLGASARGYPTEATGGQNRYGVSRAD